MTCVGFLRLLTAAWVTSCDQQFSVCVCSPRPITQIGVRVIALGRYLSSDTASIIVSGSVQEGDMTSSRFVDTRDGTVAERSEQIRDRWRDYKAGCFLS